MGEKNILVGNKEVGFIKIDALKGCKETMRGLALSLFLQQHYYEELQAAE